MADLVKVLGVLLISSASCLLLGGSLLYVYRLVPDSLVELTASAVVIILLLAYLVLKVNKAAINISTMLGVISPVFSLMIPAHTGILLSFGANLLLSILGILQFVGFVLLPILFVILRITFRKQIPFSIRKLE